LRESTDNLVRELVLADPAPFVPLTMKKRGKKIDNEAKTVLLAARRYIVCRNRQEAEKDAADRASIVAALERQLPRATRRWSATPAFGATSRRSATSTSRNSSALGGPS
jgi:hypothetical protein